jgi:hypothetical protein
VIVHGRRAAPVALALLLAGCAEPEAPAEATTPFRPLLDVEETMHLIVDPAADVIWSSAGQIITAEGTEDLAPTTEEGWHHVEQAAAVLAESGNLLMLPTRAQGRADWIAYAGGMIDTGEMALQAAAAQDADALFEAGAAIYQVCLACHQRYDRDEEASVNASP